MGAYRLYLLNEGRRIVAADVFDASRDAEATAMAIHLSRACSDMCAGFELWQADRQVAARSRCNKTEAGKIATSLTEATQNAVVEREGRLRDSRSRVAQRRNLLARINRVRAAKTGDG
jgi:hypothetical protein